MGVARRGKCFIMRSLCILGDELEYKIYIMSEEGREDMEAATWDKSMLLADDEPLSEQQFKRLIQEVRSGERERLHFAEDFEASVKKRISSLSQGTVRPMKVGQGYYALGNYAKAVEWFDKSGKGAQQLWLKACSLRELGQYEGAVSAFEQAEEKGYDSFDTAMAVVETLRRQGDLEGAEQRLKRVSRMGDIRAEFHYQLGRLHDANGRREEAMAEYERAISLDGNHTQALFSLAFACDLYGDEKEAIRYYKRCLESGTMHISALMNLAVLYEDAGDYGEARDCARRVLLAYPNHERARMYLKDIESSMTMYYDEELEKRVDYRNQMLQIPISDFELSVRARNCLKKMNIKYLGDLLRVTESELLAYKNFGETSLQEIKGVLTQKALRLGQLLEDHNNARPLALEDSEQDKIADETVSMGISELQLSVRSRKCLQRLNISTVGELVRCTEAELLGCKNFGLTSLYEIKQRLKDRGLALRVLQD